MMTRIKFCFILIFSAVILAACALGDSRPPAMLYDLGPFETGRKVSLPAAMPPIQTRVNAPGWMNENLMFYRLDYVNNQQIRFYTESSWNAAPSRLLKSRLDAFLVSSGNPVVGARTASPPLVLRIHIEDFSQHFSSLNDSVGRIALYASLFNGRDLIAQKVFRKDVVSQTPDAQGGARALAEGSDALIAEIMQWMLEQQL